MVTNVHCSQYIYTSIWLQMFIVVNTYIHLYGYKCSLLSIHIYIYMVTNVHCSQYIYTSLWLQMFIVVNTYIHLYGYKCSL